MFKRNIKIILAGIVSLALVFLAYGLLNDRPEIISDDSLRIEEPDAPKLSANFEIKSNVANMPLSDQQIKSSLESKLIDQPVAIYREDLARADYVSPDEVSEGASSMKLVELKGASEKQKVESATEPKVALRSELSFEAPEQVEGVAVFEAAADEPLAEYEQESDVEIIPESSDFLDLNLVETKPDQGMVLVEGDQLIVDDINQLIVKGEKGFGVKVESQTLKRSSAIEPEIDEELMQGDSEISKQYRQTMTKLISINAKLRAADEENVYLQQQFEMSVFNNQQLAQIIRDIDDQIKAFTLTN